MAPTLTPRERVEKTLNFQEVDVVATGEIIQNSALVSLFAGRTVTEDWTLEELARTYRALQIDVGMLMAAASTPRREKRHGLTYQVTSWSEWVVERPFKDIYGLREFLKKLMRDVERSEPESIWSYAGKGGIIG